MMQGPQANSCEVVSLDYQSYVLFGEHLRTIAKITVASSHCYGYIMSVSLPSSHVAAD